MTTVGNSNESTIRPRILVVDDDDQVRTTLGAVLTSEQFSVTTAASVSEALFLIGAGTFDVLLCDLRMPGAGDGFTVVSAMRHLNPKAITLVFTGYPALQEAMNAILLQADEILVKPMDILSLVSLIRSKLHKHEARKPIAVERVATILERDSQVTIAQWLGRVERVNELSAIALDTEQRTRHLPSLLRELVERLRVARNLGTTVVSDAAAVHGQTRQLQGYTVPMLVEESRILQVSIFETLQRNLNAVDFSSLLVDVMTIADEVDSQLKQSVSSFIAQATFANKAA